jgi:hypothetical protein
MHLLAVHNMQLGKCLPDGTDTEGERTRTSSSQACWDDSWGLSDYSEHQKVPVFIPLSRRHVYILVKAPGITPPLLRLFTAPASALMFFIGVVSLGGTVSLYEFISRGARHFWKFMRPANVSYTFISNKWRKWIRTSVTRPEDIKISEKTLTIGNFQHIALWSYNRMKELYLCHTLKVS